jgi:hypothetical protein
VIILCSNWTSTRPARGDPADLAAAEHDALQGPPVLGHQGETPLAQQRSELSTLAAKGSITLVTAGSAQSALPGTAGLAAVNGALEQPWPYSRSSSPRAESTPSRPE